MKEYIVNLTDISEYGRRMIIGNGIPKEELIRCDECEYHRNGINMCDVWHAHTNRDGYCHRGRKYGKEEKQEEK